MKTMKLSELPKIELNDDLLLYVADTNKRMSGSITIRQLIGIQQETLNRPCQYCGSRGKYDRRGNCGACGAPVEGK